MALTDVKIRQTKPLDKPFKLADSGGLYLFVSPSGSKLWRYKFRIAGKENVFAIGEYPALSLQDARRAWRCVSWMSFFNSFQRVDCFANPEPQINQLRYMIPISVSNGAMRSG